MPGQLLTAVAESSNGTEDSSSGSEAEHEEVHVQQIFSAEDAASINSATSAHMDRLFAVEAL